ncbi:MAG TPA: MarR family transcriptional regulator [Tenacibaculum sp.]|nr:MarR family transcriptional regulator [Tenacibaculum sp.]
MSAEVLRELGAVYRILNSFSDFILKSMALEKGQYQFLVRIKETPGLNQQMLSDNLYVCKSTTAKAVKKLMVKGYISRSVFKNDKRNYQLYLTKKGEEICRFLEFEEYFAMTTSLKGMEDKEIDLLVSSLKRIRKNVTPLFNDLKNSERESLIEKIRMNGLNMK